MDSSVDSVSQHHALHRLHSLPGAWSLEHKVTKSWKREGDGEGAEGLP